MGPCDPLETQQGQVQGPAHESGQTPLSVGGEWIPHSPKEKDLGILVNEKVGVS